MSIIVQCLKESKFPLLPEITIKNENSKVVVRKVPANGIFDEAGVKDGDIIKRVNDTSFENISSTEVFRFLSSIEGNLAIVIEHAVKDEPVENPIPAKKMKRKAMKRKLEESNSGICSPVTSDAESCPNCDEKFSSISAVSAHFNQVHAKENSSSAPKKLRTPSVENSKHVEDPAKIVLLRENLILKKKIEKLNQDIGNFAKNQEAINQQIEQVKINANKNNLEKENKLVEMEENLKIKQRTMDQLVEDNKILAEEASKYSDFDQEKTALENLVAEQFEENKNLKEEYRSQIDDMTLQMEALRNITDDIRLRTSAAELKEKDLKKTYEEKFQKLLKELSDLQQNYDSLMSKKEVFSSETERNKELELELERKTEMIKKLELDVNSKTERNKELELELYNKTEVIKELESDLDNKTERNKELESELDSKTERNKELESDLESKTERNKELELELKVKTMKYLSIKEKQSETVKKNERLETKIIESEMSLSDYIKNSKQAVQDLNTTISNLRHNLDILETEKNNEISKLRQNVEHLECELDKDKKIKDALTKEIEKVTNESKARADDKVMDNQIEKEMLKMMDKENNKLREEAKRLSKKNVDHQEELKKIHTKNKELKEKVNKFDAYIVEMTQFMRLVNSSKIHESTKEETVFRKRETEESLLTVRNKIDRRPKDTCEEKYSPLQDDGRRSSKNDPRKSASYLKWRKLGNNVANNDALDLEPINSPEKYVENDESSTSKAPVKFVIKSLSRTIGK